VGTERRLLTRARGALGPHDVGALPHWPGTEASSRRNSTVLRNGEAPVGHPVGNVLKRYCILPAPQRKKTTTWKEFIRSHMDVLAAPTSSRRTYGPQADLSPTTSSFSYTSRHDVYTLLESLHILTSN
jgi:hypothetical protein